MNLRDYIHDVQNFPKEGIIFKDITPLLKDPKAYAYSIDQFVEFAKHQGATKIAGIESRGFLFGNLLAQKLKLPFILIRKRGKLPKETISQEYGLEYGTDHVEVQKEDISANDKVLIIDDVLATGGTAQAAVQLVKKLGAQVVGISFLMELRFLNGRTKLEGTQIQSLLDY